MESVVVVENTPIESTLEKDEKTDDRIVVHGEEYTLEEIVELMDAQIEQLYETPQATRTSTCLEFLSYLQSAIRKPPRNVKKVCLVLHRCRVFNQLTSYTYYARNKTVQWQKWRTDLPGWQAWDWWR
jgi:hypothetical protein